MACKGIGAVALCDDVAHWLEAQSVIFKWLLDVEE